LAFLLISYNGYTANPRTLGDPPLSSSQVVDAAADYRRMLSAVNPLDRFPHSKTLGVASRLYVIGLPHREDRHIELEKLQNAMDITFTWHNATYRDAPVITEILERIRIAREESRKGHPKDPQNPESFPSAFADDVTCNDFLQPGDIPGSELWILPPSSPLALPPLPAPPVPDHRPHDSVVWGDSPNPEWPLKPVEIACWHSHFEVLRKIADGDDDVAIILEDDIDMEWDLERRLRYLWQFLPDDRDIVMLGHCLSDEATKKMEGTTYLYHSQQPMCTHAYAVSKKSAAHYVRIMRSPLFAYSRPLDHAYIFLNERYHVNSFSVYPPVIVQSGTTQGDISGMGPGEFLFDG